MATTINSGYANSPKLTANIADHADVFGGRALVFDGVTDYLDCNDLTSTTRSNMTISLWFHRSASGTVHICSRDDEGSNRNWSMYIFNNLINFDFIISNSGKNTVGATAIPVNSWTHLAFTHNGSSQAWYVNGKLDGTSSHSGAIDNDSVNMYIGRRAGNYLNGKISDFKVFDTALTEAQVTELYKKPENIPSAVQDNLVAWYPMCESNPESPQSIVYDHSEKKLGSELVDNNTSSGWVDNSDGSTITNITNGVSIADDSGFSDIGYFRDSSILSTDLTVGKLYKVQVDAFHNGVSTIELRIRDGASNQLINLTTTNTTYTRYIIAQSATGGSIRTNNHASGSIAYLTNLSVKEVLMGNHATTNFFGDELHDSTWVNSDLLGFASASATGFTAVNTDSGQGNNDNAYGKQITFTAGKTYKIAFTITANSGVALPVIFYGIASNDGGNLNTTQTNVSGAGSNSMTFTPSSTLTNYYPYVRNGVNAVYNYTISDYSIKEVGISSSGFETAVNEPVVPQVPLMRYNQKMLFSDANYVNCGALLGDNLSGGLTISLWFNATATATNNGLFSFNSGLEIASIFENNKVAFYLNGAKWSESSTITLGKTYHVVFSLDTSSHANSGIYINGVKDSTGTATNFPASDVLDLASLPFIIGRYYSDAFSHDGLIDSVSMFNTAFDSTQVQELFNDGVALDATTHSKKGNLLGYWRNDGVSTWTDRRGWSFLDFDGNDDKITTNADSTLADVTYIWWMKASDTGSNAGIFGHGTGSDNTNTSFNLNWASNRSLLYRAGNNWRYWNDTSAQDDGQWHCWAVVNDADDITGCKLYVDGVEISVYDTANAESAKAYASGLIIGHSGGTNYGEADIAKFAVYSGLKDQTFIDAEFNKGINSDWSSNLDLLGYWKMNNATTVKDLSGNGNDGTVTGATLNDGNDGDVQGSPDSITIREGLNSNRDGLGFYFTNPSNNVLRLNGVDEHLKLPYTKSFDMGDGSFTVCAWVKTTLGVGDSIKTILWARDNDDSFKGFEFQIDDGADRPRFILSDGSGGECLGTNYSVESDKWHFVAVIVDKENDLAKIFLSESDGSALKCQTTTDISSRGNINATPDWYIGKRNNATTQDFMGIIDELMVYNIALTAFESDGTTVEAGDTVTSGELLKNYKFSKGKHKND